MSIRGQLQIGVTTMVLIVFIVLLLFSLVLYFRFTYQGLEETKASLFDQRYNNLLSVIIGMPEFRCSRGGVESECLDAVKLFAFSDVVKNNNEYNKYYDNLFGSVKGIWVEVPADTGDAYPNKKEFSIYGSKGAIGGIYSVPVSLYYPESKTYKIGVLKIRGEL